MKPVAPLRARVKLIPILAAAPLLSPLLIRADLVVMVDSPKVTATKAVVKLTIKNTFIEKVESARATVWGQRQNARPGNSMGYWGK